MSLLLMFAGTGIGGTPPYIPIVDEGNLGAGGRGTRQPLQPKPHRASRRLPYWVGLEIRVTLAWSWQVRGAVRVTVDTQPASTTPRLGVTRRPPLPAATPEPADLFPWLEAVPLYQPPLLSGTVLIGLSLGDVVAHGQLEWVDTDEEFVISEVIRQLGELMRNSVLPNPQEVVQ